MNEVERILTDAQRQHHRKRLFGVIAICIITLTAVAVYFATTRVGQLKVVISPADAATAAVIEIVDGTGFVWNTKIWALKGTLQFRVLADGFEPENLQVFSATWARGKIDVVMRERLASLQAVTVPELPNTHWYLNEVFVAEAMRLNTQVNSGRYRLSAQHSYYSTGTQDLTVERGGEYRLTLPLSPIQGQISITSEPEGATVLIESETIGKTPLQLGVAGGTQELVIAYDGYTSQTDTIRITNRAPQVKRHYELARARAAVTFDLSPKGGDLSVNGQLITATNVELAVNVRHKVQYSRVGYISKSVDFTVQSERGNVIQIELQPIYGLVDVVSDPPAEILIDGKILGLTPRQLKLLAVAQKITLRRPGFRPQMRTIVPDPNASQNVFVKLVSEKQFRLENAPPEYTNISGIVLKLFKGPNSVTLGSPRGEIGRRANEFVREVHLVKPFYAGIHEVTVDQFQQFSNPGKISPPNRHPVTNIDWGDAAKFCNWLSDKEGLAKVYLFLGDQFMGSDPTADGYRMLTEAEWEWLARKAGRKKQTTFTWGDSNTIPKKSGNLADESAQGSVPSYIPNYMDGQPKLSEVGLFEANAAGIHDLAGNATEWTHDAYSLQPPAKNVVETDPMERGISEQRTVRGSSWRSADLSELRAAWRDGSSSKRDDVGFRIARYLL